MLERPYSQIKYILAESMTSQTFNGGVGSQSVNILFSYYPSPQFLSSKSKQTALHTESDLILTSNSALLTKLALRARKAVAMPTLPCGSQTISPSAKNLSKQLITAQAKLDSSSKNLLNCIGYRLKNPVQQMLAMLEDIEQLSRIYEKLNDR